MKEECCNTCAKGKLHMTDTVENILCYEITFRACIVENEKLSSIKSHSIRIVDIDNFKCDFYKKRE